MLSQLVTRENFCAVRRGRQRGRACGRGPTAWLWLVLVVAPWCHPLAGIVGVLPTSWISRTRVLMLLVTCLLWEVQLPFWQLWNQSFGEHVSFTSEFSR